jgi:hypothetical protein
MDLTTPVIAEGTSSAAAVITAPSRIAQHLQQRHGREGSVPRGKEVAMSHEQQQGVSAKKG